MNKPGPRQGRESCRLHTSQPRTPHRYAMLVSVASGAIWAELAPRATRGRGRSLTGLIHPNEYAAKLICRPAVDCTENCSLPAKSILQTLPHQHYRASENAGVDLVAVPAAHASSASLLPDWSYSCYPAVGHDSRARPCLSAASASPNKLFSRCRLPSTARSTIARK